MSDAYIYIKDSYYYKWTIWCIVFLIGFIVVLNKEYFLNTFNVESLIINVILVIVFFILWNFILKIILYTCIKIEEDELYIQWSKQTKFVKIEYSKIEKKHSRLGGVKYTFDYNIDNDILIPFDLRGVGVLSESMFTKSDFLKLSLFIDSKIFVNL